jgi:hypothetical protein
MTSEWRNITLGELDDELTRIKQETAEIDANYKFLPPDGPERDVRFNADVNRGLELGQDLREAVKKLYPLIERLFEYDVFVIQMGSADSIARWVKANIACQELTAKVTSICMGEESFWIQLNLETKTTGLN